MNSLESNLSLELFGRNGGTLVSTALLCWMRSAQSVYLERDREEDEKWRVPQSCWAAKSSHICHFIWYLHQRSGIAIAFSSPHPREWNQGKS